MIQNEVHNSMRVESVYTVDDLQSLYYYVTTLCASTLSIWCVPMRKQTAVCEYTTANCQVEYNIVVTYSRVLPNIILKNTE